MREIGGYFELENLIDNEYYKDAIRLNSGRSALRYLIKIRKVRKIWIPYFLCDCIEKAMQRENVEIGYYKIKFNFEIDFCDAKIEEDDYIYIVNYYGQLTDEYIFKVYEKYKNVILDNTQAFYHKIDIKIDTIYSCRKFFGVSDGAYLRGKGLSRLDLEEDKSLERIEHLIGRYEENASKYFAKFQENDEKFYNEDIKYMSRFTKNILKAIDYGEVIRKRNENFKYLQQNLSKYNVIKIKDVNGPYMYPLYLENAIDIKKKLIEKKIYIATLWPNINKKNDGIAFKLAENILPIPCDQRYGIVEMEYIIENIKEEL